MSQTNLLLDIVTLPCTATPLFPMNNKYSKFNFCIHKRYDTILVVDSNSRDIDRTMYIKLSFGTKKSRSYMFIIAVVDLTEFACM